MLTQLSLLDHLTSSRNNLLLNDGAIEILDGEKIAIYNVFQGFYLDKWEKDLFHELRKAKFRIIAVINTNEKSSLQETIPEDVSLVLRRKNRGYDLAGVKDCLELFTSNPEELLLINSSVAWHKAGLPNILSQSKHFAGVIAAVNSSQTREHLQSFYFHATTSESVTILKEVYAGMRNWKSKRAAVNFGEIPILYKLTALDARIKILFPYEELLSKFHEKQSQIELVKNQKLNPSVNLWRELIEVGFPGVKRNIFGIRGNRRFLNEVKSIEEALNQIDNI